MYIPLKYQLLEHISLTEVDDEIVLLDLNSGGYFGLNHVGAHFLKIVMADEAVNHIEQASREIAKKYEMPVDDVEADLEELAQQLTEQRLLAPK